MLILVRAFTWLLRHESGVDLYEIIGQKLSEDIGLCFFDFGKY